MPNHTPVFVEQRVLAYALGHADERPKRASAELARAKWGGIKLSPNGVYRVLKRHGLDTSAKRLALIAGTAAPPEPENSPSPQGERHLDADRPGQLVQMDCFYMGACRASGAPRGNTRRSTSPPHTCGPRSTSPPEIPPPATSRRWREGLLRTSPGGAGGSRRS